MELGMRVIGYELSMRGTYSNMFKINSCKLETRITSSNEVFPEGGITGNSRTFIG